METKHKETTGDLTNAIDGVTDATTKNIFKTLVTRLEACEEKTKLLKMKCMSFKGEFSLWSVTIAKTALYS